MPLKLKQSTPAAPCRGFFVFPFWGAEMLRSVFLSLLCLVPVSVARAQGEGQAYTALTDGGAMLALADDELEYCRQLIEAGRALGLAMRPGLGWEAEPRMRAANRQLDTGWAAYYTGQWDMATHQGDAAFWNAWHCYFHFVDVAEELENEIAGAAPDDQYENF